MSSYLSESWGVLCNPGDPGHGDEDGRLVGHVLHPDEDGGRGSVDLAKIGCPVASQDLKVVARFPLVVEVLRGMSSLSHFNHDCILKGFDCKNESLFCVRAPNYDSGPWKV